MPTTITPPASAPTPTTLFVATDVDCRDFTTPGHEDVTCDGKCFRRLSPDYYAWLRSQMERVRQHHTRGMIPDAHYQALRDRFNTMHDRAVALFGEAALIEAMRSFTPDTYIVPSVRYSHAVDVLLRDAVTSEEGLPASAPTSTDAADPYAGLPVCLDSGSGCGHITRAFPADEWMPHGWAEVQLDDGRVGSADLRALRHADGTSLIAHLTYTAYEQRAIALARDETPEDFADLEASLPILAFPVPGAWRFEEEPSLDDFLKVNDMREQAHALGWTDADLFQTSGRFRFPCGQDYGLVCFLRGCTIGEITAETIALLPAQPGGAVLTFTRPHRSPAPEEVPDGTIRQALPERGTTPTQAATGGVTKLRRRQNAVRAVSGHATGLQPDARAGLAHAGLFAEPNCVPDRTV